VKPTTVLYVAAERAAVLGERQEAWTKYHKEPIPDQFVELSAAPLLHVGEDLAALVEIVREVQPRLIIVDTLAQTTLGISENDGAEWGNVVQALNTLRDATDGGSVLAVHHTGKDPTKGARGHTVLLGNVDATYELSSTEDAIRVKVPKLSAAKTPMPEWFRLEPVALEPHPKDPDGLPRSAAVLVPSTVKVATDPQRQKLLDLLEGAYSDVGMTRAEIQEALELHRNTVQPMLKSLQDDGLVARKGNGNAIRYYRNGEKHDQYDLKPDQYDLGEF
jgi:DNA-binding transcriptional ArsR family regulator